MTQPQLGRTRESHARRMGVLRALDPRRWMAPDSVSDHGYCIDDLDALVDLGYAEVQGEPMARTYLPTYKGLQLRRKTS